MFEYTEWDAMPPNMRKIVGNRVIVARNVHTEERDGRTVWVGESAIMSESAYAAYSGAAEAEKRRENAIIDEYTEQLIKGGII